MINNMENLDYPFYDYDGDGEHRGFEFRSPLCVNTFRFDIYRNWTIDQILVFEAFIIFTFKYGNKFYRTIKHLIKDLNLTKYTLQKNIQFLVDEGYVKKKKGSEFNKYKNTYEVDYDRIMDNIDNIYNFNILPDNGRFVRGLYIRLFQSYAYRTHPENRKSYEGYYLFKASTDK